MVISKTERMLVEKLALNPEKSLCFSLLLTRSKTKAITKSVTKFVRIPAPHINVIANRPGLKATTVFPTILFVVRAKIVWFQVFWIVSVFLFLRFWLDDFGGPQIEWTNWSYVPFLIVFLRPGF